MRNNFHFFKSVFGKITVLLAFSFFIFGCHTGNEPVPVPQTTIKKERARRIAGEPPRSNTGTSKIVKSDNNQKRPETSLQRDASGLLLPENTPAKNPIPFPNHTKNAGLVQQHTQRDPFASPAILQEPKVAIPELLSLASGKQTVSNHLQQKPTQTLPVHNKSATPPNPTEPCITGIFDNGKEKFVLLRWRKIQGVFRCGESLGNGYYIKVITCSAVELCPQQNGYGKDSIMLLLH